MRLISLDVKHGRTLDDARARLEKVAADTEAQFGGLVQRYEWNADRTNVTGAATLGAATVNASFAAGTSVAKRYTILNATGGLGGSTFGSLVNTNLPANFSSALSYDANNAYLTLQVGGFAAAAQNPTQAAVGAALDAGAPNATGDFATVLGTLATQSASQVLPVLTALSGTLTMFALRVRPARTSFSASSM